MTTFDVLEATSRTYEATLQDPQGAPIPLAQLTALTLTLFVSEACGPSPTIVNSRNVQNVRNANNVTVDADSGLLRWEVQPADTAMLVTSRGYETHVARFSWTFDDGLGGPPRQGHHQVALRVENLRLVP